MLGEVGFIGTINDNQREKLQALQQWGVLVRYQSVQSGYSFHYETGKYE